MKIKDALQKKGGEKSNVTVGTVEKFQGDERDIIIISTVRCCDLLKDEDKKFNLGFLNNAKVSFQKAFNDLFMGMLLLQ